VRARLVCSGYERVWILEDSEPGDPLRPLFDLVLDRSPFEEEIGFGPQRRDEAVTGRGGDRLELIYQGTRAAEVVVPSYDAWLPGSPPARQLGSRAARSFVDRAESACVHKCQWLGRLRPAGRPARGSESPGIPGYFGHPGASGEGRIAA
jgi:hypothetical protein